MKKIKPYLKPRVFVAAIIWIVTCAVLYYIEYKLYAGAIYTGVGFLILYAPMSFLFWALFWRNIDKEEKNQAPATVIIAVLLCVAIIVILIVGENFFLNFLCWEMMALASVSVIVTIIEKRQQKKLISRYYSNSISVVYSAFLLAALLYLLIMRPTAVDGARQALINAGYVDLTFIGRISDEAWNGYHASADIPARENRLGAYVFSYEPEGRERRVFVDVESGEFIMEIDMEEYYNSRTTPQPGDNPIPTSSAPNLELYPQEEPDSGATENPAASSADLELFSTGSPALSSDETPVTTANPKASSPNLEIE